jgi:hypothetical protein
MLENRQKQDIPQNPSKSWSNFNGRKELRSHLMSIQKGLCAYCEIRLENELGISNISNQNHLIPN